MRPSARFAAHRSLIQHLVWLGLVLALPTGCRQQPETGGPSEHKGARIHILADHFATPIRNYQIFLLEKLVKSRPFMTLVKYNAGGDAARQAEQVQTSVQDHADFLVVFPVNAEKLAPSLRQALARGTKVFSLASESPTDACTASIVTDERELGETAGKYILSALQIKAQSEGQPTPTGRVVLLRGSETDLASEQRAAGFTEALSKAPGIVLVHDAPGNWNEADAAARTKEALRIQKQFDVIYAQNDLMAVGAAKAAREVSIDARESMLILGTDGVPGTGAGADLVVRGTIEATIYHPPLVDVAWRDMQILLDDPTYQPRQRRTVRPFVIQSENAPRVLSQGLPLPDVE